MLLRHLEGQASVAGVVPPSGLTVLSPCLEMSLVTTFRVIFLMCNPTDACALVRLTVCRWRILKTGIRLHDMESVDRVWKTCCALHNWLLEIDGLTEGWAEGKATEFEGVFGHHLAEDVQMFGGGGPADSDLSGMGPGDDPEFSARAGVVGAAGVGAVAGTTRAVRELSLAEFRQALITHWPIRSRRVAGDPIRWPSRHGDKSYFLGPALLALAQSANFLS